MTKPLSQRGKRYEFDAIVIGAGVAGLSYILKLSELNPKLKVALIVKQALKNSNSYHAQGGVSASVNEAQSINAHIKDTMDAGRKLCHPNVVKTFIQQSSQCIDFFKQHGVEFSNKDLAQEGGHSERRIHHFGDRTGQAIADALIKSSKKCSNVTFFESHTAVNLITQSERHTPGANSEIIGCYVLDEKRNKIDTFLSATTILATGGAGKVFRYTSNPDTATGDGVAMAYRAGARVGNLEFYQFHPTLLYHRQRNNLLISEVLRGEGAKLLNADGKRFMRHYEPKLKELAPRDVVARAIFSEIESSMENCVYLDIRHHPKKFLQKRFSYIFSELMQLGIDMSKDLIPVVPAAHYLCGGILSDTHGKTDLKRLYAIGETAFTGFNGANRLASNSLLEACLMGILCADESQNNIQMPLKHRRTIIDWDSEQVTDLRRASQINTHWRGLRGEMTSYAGIVRTEAGLKDLRNLILSRRKMIEDYYQKHAITRDVVELRNILLTAKLIVDSALLRKESRGGHFREDYPKSWRKNCDTILHAKAVQFDSE